MPQNDPKTPKYHEKLKVFLRGVQGAGAPPLAAEGGPLGRAAPEPEKKHTFELHMVLGVYATRMYAF